MHNTMKEGMYKAAPQERPNAAVVHITAALVSPRMLSPCRMIAPPPKKPMPVTTPAAMRVGSPRPAAPPNRDRYVESIQSNVQEREIRIIVRGPTVCCHLLRSKPKTTAQNKEANSLNAQSTLKT